MRSIETIQCRGGEMKNPAEYAYALDAVNDKVTRIQREHDRPGAPFDGGDES